MSAGLRVTHRRRPAAPRPDAERDRRERGVSLTVVALAMVPLLIITALVADVGYAKQRRRTFQATADAAALAAAQELDGGPTQISRAIVAVKTWTTKNQPELTSSRWNGCSDPDALTYRPDTGNTCISFDSASTPSKVRVRLPDEAQPQFFGQFASKDRLRVTAAATASRTPATTTQVAGPCGLCVIGDRTLQMSNMQEVRVTGGEIQADRLTVNLQDANNGVSPLPLKWFNSNGSNWGRNVQPAPATFNSRYSRLSAAVPNPFAALTVSYAGLTVDWSSNINAPGNTIQPDVIYRQSVNINGNVTLAPNRTYYFANNLQMNSGTLTGVNVTLVFVCTSTCNGSEGGKFNFGSNTTVNITAPSTGPYAGMAIMFDPTMTGGTPNQLSGQVTLDGAVYAKGMGFNLGNSNGVTRAWTIVAGGNFDANSGRLFVDNTKYYALGGSGTGGSAGGTISLDG